MPYSAESDEADPAADRRQQLPSPTRRPNHVVVPDPSSEYDSRILRDVLGDHLFQYTRPEW